MSGSTEIIDRLRGYLSDCQSSHQSQVEFREDVEADYRALREAVAALADEIERDGWVDPPSIAAAMRATIA